MSTQSAFFSSTYPRGLITRLCGLAWMVWMLWEGATRCFRVLKETKCQGFPNLLHGLP